jgi:hypothetical protein
VWKSRGTPGIWEDEVEKQVGGGQQSSHREQILGTMGSPELGDRMHHLCSTELMEAGGLEC